MKGQIELENHYGVDVWVNKPMDQLRKEECLCLNCNKGFCETAKILYNTCKTHNLALAVTRCKEFEVK